MNHQEFEALIPMEGAELARLIQELDPLEEMLTPVSGRAFKGITDYLAPGIIMAVLNEDMKTYSQVMGGIIALSYALGRQDTLKPMTFAIGEDTPGA